MKVQQLAHLKGDEKALADELLFAQADFIQQQHLQVHLLQLRSLSLRLYINSEPGMLFVQVAFELV